MGRNFEPKCKQCRRLGEKLMLKGERCITPKCAMVKRNYPPGFHGPKQKTNRKSDYGLQLAEKQKAKKQYNLMEKQFRLTFEKAKQQAGNTGENFLILLETRLDNIVFRLGFAESRNQSRQFVTHGHITVNGKKVNIPSYFAKKGDVIAIKAKSRNDKMFKGLSEKLKNYKAPGWLYLEIKELSGKVLHKPKKENVDININAQMIVEFYSK